MGQGQRLIGRCSEVPLALRAFGGLVAAALTSTLAVAAGATPAGAAAVGFERTWRVEVPGATFLESSPLPVDLDGDGVDDLVVGGLDGQVRALSGTDGRALPGWPRPAAKGVNSAPAAADTDGDGRPEVFVGAGTGMHGEDDGGALHSFEHDGTPRFRFRADDRVRCDASLCGFTAANVHATPALGDIDADGQADATFGTLGLRSIWSVGERGTAKAGFPYYSDDTVFSSPALADLDGDGRTDFVIGTDASPGGPVDHRGGVLRALRGDGSQIWEARVDEIIRSSPVVGDIDGDGQPEVVVGTGDYWSRQPGSTTRDHTRLFAFERDGRLRWAVDTGGSTIAAPALADVTGDGRLDVVIGTGTRRAPNGGRVRAYDGTDGRLVLDTPGAERPEDIIGGVSTADVDGDGRQDVFTPTGSGVYLRSGADGAMLASFNVGQVAYQGTPAVGDVDRDGRLDVLLAGTTPGGTGILERWELRGTAGRVGATSWPMARHDARRTGNATPPPLTQSTCGPAEREGYWLVASDGGIFAFCGAGFHGSAGGGPLNQPVVGMEATPRRQGYWLVARDGGIFSYGDARFLGSTGAMRLNQPVVGMAATPSGNGYWLVAADGGIFAFGDAAFHGSTGALRLRSPITGMAPTPTGRGYWLVAADGGIFAFGDAAFHGSAGATPLAAPVVGMAATPTGRGYWLTAADGRVLAYGDAPGHGSVPGPLNRPVVGMADRPAGGYYLAATDGGIFSFGGAPFLGSTGHLRLNRPVVGMATR
jgi:hypothetical protein